MLIKDKKNIMKKSDDDDLVSFVSKTCKEFDLLVSLSQK